MTLLFANRTEKDVPLKKKFEAWAEEAPEQFTVHYLYSQVLLFSFSNVFAFLTWSRSR